MKPRIVVWDIDDVLTPTSLTFYDSVVRTHGTCIHPENWVDYSWGKHVNLPEGIETQKYITENSLIENTVPFTYTKEALTLVKDAGFKNSLLSARAYHPHPDEATDDWLIQRDLRNLVDQMYFVRVDDSKHHVLEKLKLHYDIHAFVEDNPFHACAALDIVPNVYLLRRSWNKDYQDHPRLRHVDTALDAAHHILQTFCEL